ncbi:MAG: fumarylacetoacetate hydrolase family protein, partial [Candidatus Bathyarchaeia archaeon]
MKLVRYRYVKEESYGILTGGNSVVCLPRLAKHLGIRLPKNLEGFIEKSEKTVKIAEDLLRKAERGIVSSFSLPLSQITLLAPIKYPPKVICLGLNYMDHIEERITEHGARIPDEPIIFMKPRTAVVGPFDNIVKPSFVKKLDYEAELAI